MSDTLSLNPNILSPSELAAANLTSVLESLVAAKTPTQKAVVIAESAFAQMDEPSANIARGCCILRWFDQSVLAVLLPSTLTPIERTNQSINLYRVLAQLPFVEQLDSNRLTYHDQTRRGLMEHYAASQAKYLCEVAELAATTFLKYDPTNVGEIEALYCYVVAGNQSETSTLLDRLISRFTESQEWETLLTVFKMFDSATLSLVSTPVALSGFHYFVRGLANHKMGNLDQASDYYDKAIEFQPDLPQAYYSRGLLQKEQGRLDEALSDINIAIKLKPDIAQTFYYDRALVHAAQGKTSKAIADFNEAFKRQRDLVTSKKIDKPVGKSKFGNNSLGRYGDIYTMSLFDGGQWSFDRIELLILDTVLAGFQMDSWAIEKRIPRLKSASFIMVRRVLNLICLEEGNRMGLFPSNKISELREAIRRELALGSDNGIGQNRRLRSRRIR